MWHIVTAVFFSSHSSVYSHLRNAEAAVAGLIFFPSLAYTNQDHKKAGTESDICSYTKRAMQNDHDVERTYTIKHKPYDQR
jgi:hypothetical protein